MPSRDDYETTWLNRAPTIDSDPLRVYGLTDQTESAQAQTSLQPSNTEIRPLRTGTENHAALTRAAYASSEELEPPQHAATDPSTTTGSPLSEIVQIDPPIPYCAPKNSL